MEFDTDWITLGRHRIRLRSTRVSDRVDAHRGGGRPAGDRQQHERARARLVEVVCRQEKTYDVVVGTTMAEDKFCAPQLEAAVAVVLGLLPDQINITVTPVTQKEVDLHFGVYERMLSEKLGTTSPIQ